jgi:superfamily II DNA or RNA helicase
MPTGSGKTTTAAHVIMGVIKKGKHALFLAHRKELIDQASKRLTQHGIKHGIIKAGSKKVNREPVQIASIQTLVNRLFPKDPEFGKWVPPVDILIIDESHHSSAKSYRRVIDFYSSALLLGLTATPERTDGSGLGELFEKMVEVISIGDLIKQGFLSDYILYEGKIKVDTSKVHMLAGEFNQAEIGAIMDDPDLIGDIFECWQKRASNRQTIIFCQNRHHGHAITKEFVANGIRAAYVDDKTPDDERDRIVRQCEAKETQVLINIGIFSEGFDIPSISCVVLAMSTASVIKFLQCIGRGMRPEDGKILLINDHGNNWRMHGLPDSPRNWSLAGRSRKEKAVVFSYTVCPKCGGTVRSTTRICYGENPDGSTCGHVFVFVEGRQELPTTQSGEMVEVARDAVVLTKKELAAKLLREQRDFLLDAFHLQVQKKYRSNYALVKFKEQFGSWPKKKHGVHIDWDLTGKFPRILRWFFNDVEVLGET